MHSLGVLQRLYQLLQNGSGHEEWIAFGVYAIVRDATVTNITLNSLFERSVTSTTVSNDYDVSIKFSKIDFKPSNEDLLSIEASLQRYRESLEVNCI